MMPTNGYELEYNASSWNSDLLKDRSNCYAYALNNQVFPNTNKIWYKQQPGEYYDPIAGGTNYTKSQVEYNVEKDFEKYSDDFSQNMIFKEVDRDEVCPAGTYKVALVIVPTGTNPDYHWYRQDSDGLWSHKPGKTAATRLDNSGLPIIDPQIADLGAYVFEGYYAVTPWSHSFDSSASYTYYAQGRDFATEQELEEWLHSIMQ